MSPFYLYNSLTFQPPFIFFFSYFSLLPLFLFYFDILSQMTSANFRYIPTTCNCFLTKFNSTLLTDVLYDTLRNLTASNYFVYCYLYKKNGINTANPLLFNLKNGLLHNIKFFSLKHDQKTICAKAKQDKQLSPAEQCLYDGPPTRPSYHQPLKGLSNEI